MKTRKEARFGTPEEVRNQVEELYQKYGFGKTNKKPRLNEDEPPAWVVEIAEKAAKKD